LSSRILVKDWKKKSKVVLSSKIERKDYSKKLSSVIVIDSFKDYHKGFSSRIFRIMAFRIVI